MNVGDEVTVVHGLTPAPTDRGTVASLARTDGKILIRFHSGGTLWVEPSMIDTGGVIVTHHTGTRHRTTDPDTARAAAERSAEQLTEHQWLVLKALVDAGQRGMLDHEHEHVNGLIPTSAGKRRLELVDVGLVEKSTLRRPTETGHMAAVWRVTARGQAVYQHHQKGAA